MQPRPVQSERILRRLVRAERAVGLEFLAPAQLPAQREPPVLVEGMLI